MNKEDFARQLVDSQEARYGFVLQFDYERKDGTGEVFEATVVQGDFTVRFIDGQNEEFETEI